MITVYRVEHRTILDSKGRFHVGPWSNDGWKEFEDQETAQEILNVMGEEMASWEFVHWEGPNVKDFQLGAVRFNQKYIAGVEKLEDLSCMKGWWEYLVLAGYCLRVYQAPENRFARATKLHWEFRDFELGSPRQCAFHWYFAVPLGEIPFVL